MNREKINSILFDAVNDADLTANEIPSIDLYLEQIIRLISDKSAQGSEIFADRVPTKTMVNNYSKAELITPLKGKTYNKEQIIQILLTNSLKNTLSIAEIKSIMDCFNKDSGDEGEDLCALYDNYISTKKINREITANAAESIISENNIDTDSSLDAILLCLALSSLADYFKCMAKSLLSEAVSEILPNTQDSEKEEEEAPAEDKKAAKKAKKAAEKAAKKAAEAQAPITEDHASDVEDLQNKGEEAED